MRAAEVDPQVRLQNIALETQELLAERSMAWSETTNRATMLMTIVGASVFALALVGNATHFDDSFLMFALVVLPVVLVVGLSTLGRIGELDLQDWRWVQGLNRLRHARLELDPGFEQYLVTSAYDDVDAVLSAYGGEESTPALHGFYILPSLIALINALIAGFLAADLLLVAHWSGLSASIVGVAVFILSIGVLIFTGYRSFVAATRAWVPRFPTPPNSSAVSEPVESGDPPKLPR